MHPSRKIRVLVVDDSAVFRGILSGGISSDMEFDPDIMVCDVVMPRMGGI